MNGTKNPHRSAVARDIVDAILKTTADKHNLAVYWDKDEQESRLIAVYGKWLRGGEVWTAAAEKVSHSSDNVGRKTLTCHRRTRTS